MTQLRMRLRWGVGLLMVVGLLGMAGGARGQVLSSGSEAHTIEPQTFGPSATTSHTLHAFAFGGFSGAHVASFEATSSGLRFCNAPCVAEAALFLPAGALVTAIELEACDTNNGGTVGAQLFRGGKLGSGVLSLAGTETGTAATPGCTAVTGHLGVPHTIDNVNNAYFVQVLGLGGGSSLRFQAVRVYYTLQVSPAPAVATFTDVPTSHPFFRFIEALAVSGITSGCGGGNFCPDTPLTRGQMAVFLSLGLGLHFAP